jgi:glyoxylase-like metal-dependent hydrolase (beta-lactamase superfamily II)
MNRRRFLGVGVAAGWGAAGLMSDASGGFLQNIARGGAKARLILLGTGGGSTPKKDRSASAQLIVVNGAVYVIDCGNGVARQLVSAGIKLRSIRDVFITHHHSDHNADYGNLLLLAWATDLNHRVDT